MVVELWHNFIASTEASPSCPCFSSSHSQNISVNILPSTLYHAWTGTCLSGFRRCWLVKVQKWALWAPTWPCCRVHQTVCANVKLCESVRSYAVHGSWCPWGSEWDAFFSVNSAITNTAFQIGAFWPIVVANLTMKRAFVGLLSDFPILISFPPSTLTNSLFRERNGLLIASFHCLENRALYSVSASKHHLPKLFWVIEQELKWKAKKPLCLGYGDVKTAQFWQLSQKTQDRGIT